MSSSYCGAKAARLLTVSALLIMSCVGVGLLKIGCRVVTCKSLIRLNILIISCNLPYVHYCCHYYGNERIAVVAGFQHKSLTGLRAAKCCSGGSRIARTRWEWERRNSKGEGAPTYSLVWLIFPEHCIKMRHIVPGAGGG